MLIDTDSKTVTFRAGETLTLDQMWNIIYTLEPEPETDYLLKFELEPLTYAPLRMQYVSSDANPFYKYLVVQLLDGHWICSCPDFTKRNKDATGETCKHIDRVLYGWP